MENRIFLFVVILYVIVIGFFIYGYFDPGGLNWGFHFFGLLSPAYFFGYCIASAVILAYAIRGNPERLISVHFQRIFRKPAFVITVVSALFIALAYSLRQRLPLLGDGFTLLNNYGNTFSGQHALIVYREPIAIYYFYYIANILQTPIYPGIMNSFLIGEIILGIGFIINLSLITRYFLPSSKDKILSLLFLAAGGYIQLFCGYAEIYSVVLFFISLYIMLVALWIHQKVPFYVISVAFLLMLFSHYLTVILFPSLLLVAYREYKGSGMKNVLIGSAISLCILLLILIGLEFDISRFVPPMTHAPYLSIGPLSDGYQAYTMFSLYHFVDLFSLAMLLGVSSIVLLGIALLVDRKKIAKSFQQKFLLAGVIPVILFIAVAKFDLGMATDWDVAAPYFFLISLFSLVTLLETEIRNKNRIMFLCVAFTIIHSLAWISVNANEESSVSRARLLGDRRMVGQKGFEQNTFQLTGYYYSRDDTRSMITLWKEYVERYPEDEKAYRRLSELLLLHESEIDIGNIQLCDRWLTLNPNNREAITRLAALRVGLGNTLFSEKRNVEAKAQYFAALAMDSLNIQALDNLGIVYGRANNNDSAIICFSKALGIDSTYDFSYENLGKAYFNAGKLQLAMESFTLMIRNNPASASGYENLAKVCFQVNDLANGVKNLRQAARLGSPTAQKLLSQRKITW